MPGKLTINFQRENNHTHIEIIILYSLRRPASPLHQILDISLSEYKQKFAITDTYYIATSRKNVPFASASSKCTRLRIFLLSVDGLKSSHPLDRPSPTFEMCPWPTRLEIQYLLASGNSNFIHCPSRNINQNNRALRHCVLASQAFESCTM